ncbi:30S ribosomal protein S17 [Candidatus Pacearchaeota archaeon]|nr:MAG: 30S ribosomal protein S17 [Candidatus Pacearchaeota archaeon]
MAKKKEMKAAKESGRSEGKKAKAIIPRGRSFEGVVVRKFPKRVTIEFERPVYIYKYERFMKKKTRIHARLPDELAHDIHVGDLIRVQECRPLSKIIHHIVIEKVRGKDESN